MPTTILSSRFNNLKNRIRAIMNNSATTSPTTGYGQTTSVSTVTGSRSVNDLDAADKITADQYKNLYIDIVRARVHQIGSAFSIDPFVVGNYPVNTASTDKVEETYISNLETVMTQIETDKFEIDLATQATLQNLTNSSGSNIQSTRLQSTFGAWNGTLTHLFVVDFNTAQERRHFFNAGGQIRFEAEIDYAFSQTKTKTWQNALSTMGSVAFKANETKSLSSGLTRSLGNYQLSSTYQLVYRNPVGGVYTGSYYEIYALETSNTQIQFRIYFRDNTSEGIDENVFGDITSAIKVARPDGDVTIGTVTYETVVFDGSIQGREITSINNP